MLIKISLLLLVALAVLGVVFRTRFPPTITTARKPKLPPIAAKCPKCGRHQIGKSDCPCDKAA